MNEFDIRPLSCLVYPDVDISELHIAIRQYYHLKEKNWLPNTKLATGDAQGYTTNRLH